ncbi:hypothetical protein D8674_011865 [Pyrus ussuriensis x Pyrus communis]|uniref:Uncharacterized protein n=1 Tax=Pyrus ussuriensis x Pyrus communis TaxID=2448454 RepID=A0A5N5G0R4_9ROSA|nr:hypothetical protein D8674_011865 [Pyrus ussuriensis x Pyrus communis]
MTAFNTIQIDLLKKTPFWPLLKAFYNKIISKDDIAKSDLDLNEMVKVFNHPTNYIYTPLVKHAKFLLCERATLIQPMIGKESSNDKIEPSRTPHQVQSRRESLNACFTFDHTYDNTTSFMVQPISKAQSEIDDCDDVKDEDYDYGNYDDARDENFDSAKNEDDEEDEGDKDEKDVQQTHQMTKRMEGHVEILNKSIEELEDINVALQVENDMFKQENEKLKKRIKELEAKIIQEDYHTTSVDTVAKFVNHMDVETRKNKAIA